MPKLLDEVEFEIVRNLQQYTEGAAIAGGSVLDMIMGVPYHDVDFFYSVSTQGYIPTWAQFADEYLPKIFDLSHGDSIRESSKRSKLPSILYVPSSEDAPNIWRVTNILKADGRKYQLISINRGNVVDHIRKNFDLNCVKVYHDGTTLHKTKEFDSFLKSGIIHSTANVAEDISGISLIRIERLLERYPDKKWELSETIKRAFEFREKMKKMQKKERAPTNKDIFETLNLKSLDQSQILNQQQGMTGIGNTGTRFTSAISMTGGWLQGISTGGNKNNT